VQHCIKANPMKTVEQFTDDEFAQHVHRAVRELPDAPAAWQQAAMAMWSAPATPSTLAAVQQAGQALVRYVSAVLTFDSWATSALAHGMRSTRSATRSATRHLLYSAQGRDIDLRITASAEHFALSGQVLGPDETGRVELARSDAPGQPSHHASLDELGEFRLQAVPAGRYVLTLHLGQDAMQVQDIDVGDTAL
jgi:hypothetical protein